MSKVIIPPVFFLLAGAAMLALDRWAPGLRLIAMPWTWLGLLPVTLGVGIAAWAARLFRHADTTVRPWDTPTAIVTTGPYRLSRNPMYLGLALTLAGLAILLGSLTPLLLLPAFVWAITARFIRREERILQTLFPVDFLIYKSRVRRWI